MNCVLRILAAKNRFSALYDEIQNINQIAEGLSLIISAYFLSLSLFSHLSPSLLSLSLSLSFSHYLTFPSLFFFFLFYFNLSSYIFLFYFFDFIFNWIKFFSPFFSLLLISIYSVLLVNILILLSKTQISYKIE